MGDLLLKYFGKRMNSEGKLTYKRKRLGPLVTISREFGCPAKQIAEKLSKALSVEFGEEWNWISKEIMEELSKELHLNPSVTKDLSNYEDRKISDYIALLLSSDYYPGESRIKNTMADIIMSFAYQGNVVIVGRAGYLITQHVLHAYHVRLVAPYDWRVDRIAETRKLSYPDAMKYVNEISKKREQFLKFYSNKGTNEDIFNDEFDTSILSDEEIVVKIVENIRERKVF